MSHHFCDCICASSLVHHLSKAAISPVLAPGAPYKPPLLNIVVSGQHNCVILSTAVCCIRSLWTVINRCAMARRVKPLFEPLRERHACNHGCTIQTQVLLNLECHAAGGQDRPRQCQRWWWWQMIIFQSVLGFSNEGLSIIAHCVKL